VPSALNKGKGINVRGLRWCGAVCLLATIIFASATPPVGATNGFFTVGFQHQWEAGEAIVPNFWGPLANAKDGQLEPYEGGPNGMRQVQYFDKARMEQLTGTSPVTNGLLANELITGKVPVSDAAFQQAQPATIPIAGDPNNPGPTYAQLGTVAASLLAPATAKIGGFVTTIVGADGAVTDGGGFAGISMSPAISAYDATTKHNVLGVFADFRNKVGLASVGLATSEPFRATVKIAGTPQSIIAQVFERRVLTYNNGNADPFKVEFGNIGQHYYQWRYPTGAPLTVPPPTTPPTTASDPGPVALQALPAGYTIKTTQTVDLGVEGQEQAIIVAENMAVHGQIAALLVQKNGIWTVAFRTRPDDNATATISAYTKTSAHPGFVAASYHLCGANCNSGEHTVVRWDGNGATTMILNGPDDRGAFGANIATGRVSLTGPLYRTQDANCCASFRYQRTWTWQGSSLVPENMAILPIEGASALPVPPWLTQSGPLLIASLEPLLQDPSNADAIAALYRDSFTFTDLQGNACTASGAAAAKALRSLTIPSIGGLWPVDNTFRMTLTTGSSGGAQTAATALAGSCAVGGAGVGGYVVTIQSAGNDQIQLVSAQAVDQPSKAIPANAIQVPPV